MNKKGQEQLNAIGGIATGVVILAVCLVIAFLTMANIQPKTIASETESWANASDSVAHTFTTSYISNDTSLIVKYGSSTLRNALDYTISLDSSGYADTAILTDPITNSSESWSKPDNETWHKVSTARIISGVNFQVLNGTEQKVLTDGIDYEYNVSTGNYVDSIKIKAAMNETLGGTTKTLNFTYYPDTYDNKVLSVSFNTHAEAYQATDTLRNATAGIPGWTVLAILISIGGLLFALISKLRND
jgi:hypothetical protein